MARFAMRRMMTSGQLSIVTLNDVSRSSVNHDCAVLPAAEAAAVMMMMMMMMTTMMRMAMIMRIRIILGNKTATPFCT